MTVGLALVRTDVWSDVQRTSAVPWELARELPLASAQQHGILQVNESSYTIHEGFPSEEPSNPSLAAMMEQEIARVVNEWKKGERVFPNTTTDLTLVKKMEHDLGVDLAERYGRACVSCEEEPCVWLSNHESILAWDALEHDGLPLNEMPLANIRCKKLYRQMALTINGGPMGKGVHIEHPRCIVDGIHAIAPNPDGNYIG